MADEKATSGQIISPKYGERLTKLARALNARAVAEESEIDGTEVAASIAEKILGAETLDDIFDVAQSGMLGGRDLEGVEQRVHRIEVRRGEENSEKTNLLFGPVYLLVHAQRLSNGEELLWNTSATQLVTQLMAIEHKAAIAEQKGESPVLPIDVVIVNVGGKGALALQRIAKRAVQ